MEISFPNFKFKGELHPSQSDVVKTARELKEKLKKAETNLDEINKAAELAFKVIRNKRKKRWKKSPNCEMKSKRGETESNTN